MSEQENPTPRQHERVTQNIQPQPDGSWRVDVALDGYNVRKAFFDTYEEACTGAAAMVAQVIKEAGLYE